MCNTHITTLIYKFASDLLARYQIIRWGKSFMVFFFCVLLCILNIYGRLIRSENIVPLQFRSFKKRINYIFAWKKKSFIFDLSKEILTSSLPFQSNSSRSDAYYIENYAELDSNCHRSNLSRSLLYMQKALSLGNSGNELPEQRRLLEVSRCCLDVEKSVSLFIVWGHITLFEFFF